MINLLTLIARPSPFALRLQVPARWFPSMLGVFGCMAIASQALAETNLRSSFPGRRVGGGTRGECTARLVAHLVPKSNVFAPGSSGLIAILQGPSANLNPLIVAFKPWLVKPWLFWLILGRLMAFTDSHDSNYP